jgi:potassium/sodium efflux P-type ATPase
VQLAMAEGVLRTHSGDRLTPQQIPPDVARQISKEMERNGNFADDLAVSKMPVQTIFDKFGSSIKTGMSQSAAEKRFLEDGPNELYQPPAPSLLMLFLAQLKGFVILLLMAAAVGSLALAAISPKREDPLQYVTGVFIIIIVVINAGIAAKTEAQASDALGALAAMNAPQVTLCRDGVEVKMETRRVVKGDIVLLGVGDVVPADIRVVESADFKVSEMPLTGEPDDVPKTHKVRELKPGETPKLVPETMAFMNCTVMSGNAKVVVTSTGMDTRIGKIAQMLQKKDGDEEAKTPLQRNLDQLGSRIGVYAIGVCIIVFIVMVVMQSVPDAFDPTTCTSAACKWQAVIMYGIMTAVTLAVAAIPEGIPLCVTLSLALGCKDMVDKKVQVRKLAAVETLGSASVICTDKTGTLTEGKMTLTKVWSAGKTYEVTGKGFNPDEGGFQNSDGSDASQEAPVVSTIYSAVICSSTTLNKNEKGQWEPKGNSSEAPYIVAGRKLKFTEDEVQTKCPRVMEVPFSSARKMMLTVSNVTENRLGPGGIQLPENTKYVTVCKGAPNFILDACAQFLDSDGQFKPLTAEKKAEILGVVDDFSSQALRVLAMAIVPLEKLPYDSEDDELETDQKFAMCREGLQLVGLGAAIDPERNGVPESVIQAREAGVRVVMITGDYVKTAIAIAKNCNILQKGDDDAKDAVDCGTLRTAPGKYVDDFKMDAITARVKVFARAQPEDKLRIVESLQRQDFVCAMTGDGVNDAPALNRADIGVAMNIQGTEVAKGASDMILSDDNFANIVVAIEKGRVIYSGIQKFVAFIMSVHIAEVVQIFLCVVTSMPIMRTPIQILFLILVTDLPPSIALGREPGEPGIMKRKPRPKSEPVTLKWMTTNYTVNGLILAAVIMAVYTSSLSYFLGVFTGSQRVTLIRELSDTCESLYEHCADTGCQDTQKDFVEFDFLKASFQGSSQRVGKPGITGDLDAGWLINQDTLPSYRLFHPAAVCDPFEDWVSPSCGNAKLSIAEDWSNADYRRECAEYKGAAWVAAMMMNARTTAFISLVFSENIRAYISRSFTNHLWVKPFDNRNMQYAIGLAQMCLMVVIFVPFVKDRIIGLDGSKIGVGWLFALIGPFSCALLCEFWKLVTRVQIQKYEAKVAEQLRREAATRAEQQKLDFIKDSTDGLKIMIQDQKVQIVELERQVSKSAEEKKASNVGEV